MIRSTCMPLVLALFLELHGNPASGGSITTLHSTGQGLATGNVDPDYTIIMAPAGAILNPGGETDTIPPVSNPPYQLPPVGTQWIGPNVNNRFNEPAGNYEYQTTFTLAGFDASTAKITGAVASDNTLFGIELNGVSLGISGGGLGSFLSYTITSGFLPGNNTLEFIVTNVPDPNPPNPTALLVFQSGTATALPEPTAVVLLGLGLAMVIATTMARGKREGQ